MPKPIKPNQRPGGFHVIVKPIGPLCNLNCEYCFYTEKNALFPDGENYRITDEVLEAFIRKSFESQDIPEIPFAWQGGEPTLVGIDFFRKVVELQRKYANGKRFTNSLQTNGILLDDEWCEFLAENGFLVGLSLDGPEEIHDRYRIDRKGNPTHALVMRGLELLQKYGVEFNILACITKESARKPLDIYRFFKKHNVQFIQFIPVVERMPDAAASNLGLQLSRPIASEQEESEVAVTPWTVNPISFGSFMITIFDEWIRSDVGATYVMNFEWALSSWMGIKGSTCISSERCGNCVVMEHNGDIYSCDHHVYPEYRLGNILTDDLNDMVMSERQLAFGASKETTLTRQCRECPALFACCGECPKRRFTKSHSGEPGLNYLCAGYRLFYKHIDPYMQAMAQLLQNGYPASYIMRQIDV